MKIGLCYDLQDTYQISGKAVYKDFSFLSEVEYVECCLKKSGHRVIMINGLEEFVKNIFRYKSNCDIIFNMIEGYKSRNREGLVPALCEAFDITYTGTDSFGMSLSLNKYYINRVIESFGIKTPKAYLIDYPYSDFDSFYKFRVSLPCVIKPNNEGSSMGVTLVKSEQELLEKVNCLLDIYQQQLVVEEYIPGNEISVGILGTASQAQVYTCYEFLNEDGSDIELFDYECKYNTDFQTIPPRLNKETIDNICEKSLFIHKILKFQDISRIDWRINQNQPYFIEATPLPDLDIDSDFDLGSKAVGETFEDVLNRVLNSALNRRRNKE